MAIINYKKESPPAAASVPAGPLAKLNLQEFKTGAGALRYPLDVENYKNYLMININVPEKSSYATNMPGGGQSTADINRAAFGNPTSVDFLDAAAVGLLTGAAGAVTDVASSKGPITTGKAVGIGVKNVGKGVVTGVALGTIDMTRKTKRIAQSICLYVPDTMTSMIANQYEDVSLTAAKGNAGFAESGADAAGDAINPFSEMGAGASGFYGEGLAKAADSMKVAGVKAFGEGITSVLLASMGVAMNPQIEVLYKNIMNRQFQFSFKFTPRSQEEMKSALNIIKTLRFHAAPELLPASAAGRYFIPPSEFDIQLILRDTGQPNPAFPKISTCVLEGIDVNYASAGQWVTHDDGAPVEISVELRFKEVEIVHKKLIEEGY